MTARLVDSGARKARRSASSSSIPLKRPIHSAVTRRPKVWRTTFTRSRGNVVHRLNSRSIGIHVSGCFPTWSSLGGSWRQS